MRLTRLLRTASQKALTAMPAALQRFGVLSLSACARNCKPKWASHIHAFATGVNWKEQPLPPRAVQLTNRIPATLFPHFGEMDFSFLFFNSLNYEYGVKNWLEEHLADYTLVIEIGANVGVFTTLIAKVAQNSKQPLKIVSVEPSGKAYFRLMQNLEQNRVHNVTALRAVAGDRSGLVDFFEPEGHLTNGSLNQDFARMFSDQVSVGKVLSLGPEFFDDLMHSEARVLVKMDVEGFEPQLLTAWQNILKTRVPDLIVEVLPETVDAIKNIIRALGYQCYLLTDSDGPQLHPEVFASSTDRDWLFTMGH